KRAVIARIAIRYLDRPRYFISVHVSVLVDSFSAFCAPGESIDRPLQCDHQQPVFTRNPRRTPDDNDIIANLERLAAYSGIAKLGRAGPFDSPSLLSTGRIGSLDVNEGVRIAKYKLHYFPLELDFSAGIVGGAV